MNPTFYYCYDAWCGWCYGFSPVIRRLAADYSALGKFEVLSGGMILHDPPRPVSVMADFVSKAYQVVEERTGIRFGQDYLWHFQHPDMSDWFPDSMKSAIALCIFKEIYPDQQVFFAADLQQALHAEGRDLTDDEAYRHLLDKYHLPAEEFYDKLHSEKYAELARYEFALCRQLQVTGFPTLLLQQTESRFYLLSRGYTEEAVLRRTIENVLQSWKTSSKES